MNAEPMRLSSPLQVFGPVKDPEIVCNERGSKVRIVLDAHWIDIGVPLLSFRASDSSHFSVRVRILLADRNGCRTLFSRR